MRTAEETRAAIQELNNVANLERLQDALDGIVKPVDFLMFTVFENGKESRETKNFKTLDFILDSLFNNGYSVQVKEHNHTLCYNSFTEIVVTWPGLPTMFEPLNIDADKWIPEVDVALKESTVSGVGVLLCEQQKEAKELTLHVQPRVKLPY